METFADFCDGVVSVAQARNASAKLFIGTQKEHDSQKILGNSEVLWICVIIICGKFAVTEHWIYVMISMELSDLEYIKMCRIAHIWFSPCIRVHVFFFPLPSSLMRRHGMRRFIIIYYYRAVNTIHYSLSHCRLIFACLSHRYIHIYANSCFFSFYVHTFRTSSHMRTRRVKLVTPLYIFKSLLFAQNSSCASVAQSVWCRYLVSGIYVQRAPRSQK